MRARLVSAAVSGLLGVVPILAYEAAFGVLRPVQSGGIGWLAGAAAALVGAGLSPGIRSAPHGAGAALRGVAVTFLSVGVLGVGILCTFWILDSIAGRPATVDVRHLLPPEPWGVAAALVLSPFGALSGAAVWHLARRGEASAAMHL